MKILVTVPLFICFIVFCGLAQEVRSELRKWPAVNGKQMEARFVSNNDGQVELSLINGKTFKVPLNKLSEADQDFIKAKPYPANPVKEAPASPQSRILGFCTPSPEKAKGFLKTNAPEEAKFRALLKDLKLPAGKGDSSSTGPRGNLTNALVAQLASLSTGGNELNVDYGGQSRRLIITMPKKLARKGVHPVLFCFHGAGVKADGQSRRWSRHADKHGLIVISVEAVQPLAKWNFRDGFHAEEHDDVGFVLKVVEALISGKLADPRAIYATGHSSGGLFCYRLAKQTDVFAALSPMSCGMVKGAHDPDAKTTPVPILQVIGDQDKSFKGSSNPKVTMYSAARRMEVWRKFNQCAARPEITGQGEELEVHTFASPSGMDVVLCKAKGQGHFLRIDLRDKADSLALDFLLKHRKS